MLSLTLRSVTTPSSSHTPRGPRRPEHNKPSQFFLFTSSSYLRLLLSPCRPSKPQHGRCPRRPRTPPPSAQLHTHQGLLKRQGMALSLGVHCLLCSLLQTGLVCSNAPIGPAHSSCPSFFLHVNLGRFDNAQVLISHHLRGSADATVAEVWMCRV